MPVARPCSRVSSNTRFRADCSSSASQRMGRLLVVISLTTGSAATCPAILIAAYPGRWISCEDVLRIELFCRDDVVVIPEEGSGVTGDKPGRIEEPGVAQVACVAFHESGDLGMRARCQQSFERVKGRPHRLPSSRRLRTRHCNPAAVERGRKSMHARPGF